MRETVKLYILVPALSPWPSFRVTSLRKIMRTTQSNTKFSMLPKRFDFMKLILNLYLTINIQGIKVCLRDFMKFASNIALRPDTYEPICFTLRTLSGATKVYNFILV